MDDLKTYKPAEIEAPEFVAIVEAAKALWTESCKAHFEKYGDTGTCVLGAGIYCMLIPKGKRKAIEHMLIPAEDVAQAQGSLNWESGKNEVLAFLRANGMACRYTYGFMD